jgi:hypothetical protein
VRGIAHPGANFARFRSMIRRLPAVRGGVCVRRLETCTSIVAQNCLDPHPLAAQGSFRLLLASRVHVACSNGHVAAKAAAAHGFGHGPHA